MFKKISLIFVLILMSGSAQAAFCGSGIIIDLKEGGWNQDGLAIRLSGADSQGSSPSTLQPGSNGSKYVWFRGLSQSQLDGIRRSASLAFAMGATVWTFTHTGSCKNATELSVLNW